MPGGNIHHGDLSWPQLGDDEPADTPAQRHGVRSPVATGFCRPAPAPAGVGGVSGRGSVDAIDALLEMTPRNP